MFRILSALILCLWFSAVSLAGEWTAKQGPLMTKWAKDVTADKVHPEYPRPQMVRKDWLNLNGLWQLAFAGKDESAPFGKDLPEKILVPFPVESALSGVMKHGDRLWYRRTFTVPKQWGDNRVLLHFGAVDWEARVWVNGKWIGEHRGGYDPFSFDISGALKKEGDQEIIVGVWDPTDGGPQPRGKQVKNPGGIFYTPTTGIWQTAWLEPVNRAGYIQSLKIVPNIDKDEITISVSLSQSLGKALTSIEIQDDAVVYKASGFDSSFTFKIPDAKRWTPETPKLYTFRVIVRGEKASSGTDSVESYFGMRKIEVGKDDKGTTRILLNGKPYFQVGPLDQGFWPDGLYTAPTDEALKFDIEMTKKLGFNMTRKHVKVEPERWYYWCDKLGLLVWQDMPSGDKSIDPGKGEITRNKESAAQYEAELKAMIDALRNHPSIVMWVPFNEGWGQYDTARIAKWVKGYDPTRLVNSASGWNDMKVGDVFDIHSYPGPDSPRPEEKRSAVLGEFGGLGLGLDGHTWEKKTWGYQGVKDRAELTCRYERLMRKVHDLKEKPGLSAAVYTQITDVETEANGLLTYDRAIVKVDEKRIAAVNSGDLSKIPAIKEIVPTAATKEIVWRYTLTKPSEAWFKPDFDASTWKEGKAGFGTEGTPGAMVRTEWKTPDIWIRREFELPQHSYNTIYLSMHHDEDAEVYLNGVLAIRVTGWTTQYEEFSISEEARKTVKAGKNTIAVHCKQTTGGQYIDVGLVEIK